MEVYRHFHEARAHQRSDRKLLAIDYIGVVLSLIGCTLIILPLIWVGCCVPLLSLLADIWCVGRSHLPMDVIYHPVPVRWRCILHHTILLLGMEVCETAYRPQYALSV